ncbi:MAG: ABC transporter permease [Candidatus Absconditabacterales bacterium]
MSLRVYFKAAFLTFKENKLRSGLSSLGIIIGILSVVVLLAVGQGATASILSNVESLGTNLLSVTPGGDQQTNVRGAEGARSSENVLTTEEADIVAKLPNIAAVSPEYGSRKQAIYGANNMQVSVYGVEPSYLTVRNSRVEYGAFISQQNVNNVDKVAVIGYTTAETLFGTVNPIGKDIRLGNVILTVIGVMKQKGTSTMGNADSTVFVPLTTAQQRLFGTKYLSDIALSVTTTKMIDTAKATIEKTLLAHFNITDSADANFTVASQADVLSTVSSITSTMKLFLGAIAAISLIVGGIGVMNIMLVSVTERTREIGIRRAIGAQNRDIIFQFLAESLVLCISGGIIGVFLSYVIIFAIKNIVAGIITFSSILLAFGCATAIGLIFGIFPAYRAARLKPIDALRYE